MKTSIFGIVFFTFLAAGCSEHSVAPPMAQTTKVISPLAYGDEWIYDEQTFDSTGRLVEDFMDTTRVGLATEIQGENWYLVSDNNNLRSTFYFTNRSDGYWFFDERTNTPSLTWKYPCVAGEIYHDKIDTVLAVGSVIQCSRFYKKVVSRDEKVVIGDTTYSCYHYQTYNYFFLAGADTIARKPSTDEYIVPGIGEVRFSMPFDESFNPTTNVTIVHGTSVTTLKSYSLK
ncbi:MAG: hypothetical protein Q8916_08120 [Bacteroidota bacterium]|nr:hypothetical protein [Bacteroidota bacterium]MDP4230351.1 hypothetical protein [Bacteroidota bacterium]